jgi:tRNA-modifying protein YgfZ
MSVLVGVEGYTAFGAGTAVAELSRDIIVCRGADTIKFLHSLLSQDIEHLEVGASTWSFLLQPTGKLVGFARVHRIADGETNAVVLDTDPGGGDPLLAALTRFRIRTKCELQLHRGTVLASRASVAIQEPSAGTLEVFLDGSAPISSPAGPWWEQPAFDVLRLGGSDSSGGAAGADLVRVDAATFDVARIECGVPVFGRELTDATIPNETGLVPVAVSRTKGCYLGQELVERIDSRGGNTPHHLRKLRIEGTSVPDDGVGVLFHGDKQVGTVTSAALHPAHSCVVALGYVHRSVEVDASLEARWDEGIAPATVCE